MILKFGYSILRAARIVGIFYLCHVSRANTDIRSNIQILPTDFKVARRSFISSMSCFGSSGVVSEHEFL